MWLISSRIVNGCVASTNSPSTNTFLSLKAGKYFSTGSSNSNFPSSKSIIAAVVATGFVIDAIRNNESCFISEPVSKSRVPTCSKCTIFPFLAIIV